MNDLPVAGSSKSIFIEEDGSEEVLYDETLNQDNFSLSRTGDDESTVMVYAKEGKIYDYSQDKGIASLVDARVYLDSYMESSKWGILECLIIGASLDEAEITLKEEENKNHYFIRWEEVEDNMTTNYLVKLTHLKDEIRMKVQQENYFDDDSDPSIYREDYTISKKQPVIKLPNLTENTSNEPIKEIARISAKELEADNYQSEVNYTEDEKDLLTMKLPKTFHFSFWKSDEETSWYSFRSFEYPELLLRFRTRTEEAKEFRYGQATEKWLFEEEEEAVNYHQMWKETLEVSTDGKAIRYYGDAKEVEMELLMYSTKEKLAKEELDFIKGMAKSIVIEEFVPEK